MSMHYRSQEFYNCRVTFAALLGVSIATSKYLLAGDLKEYPLRLLFVHLVTAQLVQILYWSRGERESGFWSLWHHLKPDSTDDILAWVLIILVIPLLLVSAYQSLAFASNLPSTVMALTLTWQPSRLLEKILQRRVGLEDLSRYLVFVIGLILIYVCDFRLNLLSLRFLGFAGLAEICSEWKIAFKKSSVRLAPRDCPEQSIPWMPYALLATTVLAFHTEIVHRTHIYIRVLPIAVGLIVNTVATSIVLTAEKSHRSIVVSQQMYSANKPDSGGGEQAILRLTVAGVSSVLGTFMTSNPAVMTIWQHLGYLAALFAFTTAEEVQSLLHAATQFIYTILSRSSDNVSFSLKGTGLQVLMAVSWMGYFYRSSHLTPPPHSSIPRLDLNFTPSKSSQLDIVVARYGQPAATLAQDLLQLLQIDSLQNLETRIIIYDKQTDADEFQRDIVGIMSKYVDVSVKSLDNIGREGDTFLHHMINNWDTLATHTLFMQARMHDLRLAVNFLDTFFVPETGFLSLSYEGNVCERCEHDSTCWPENPVVWSELYSLANPGRQCQNLVLTFRGQFVVSAARIRGNDKNTYEQLLRWLSDPNSRFHSSAYMDTAWHRSQEDSLNDPVFGFTLERMWGVLMQCSELRVGYYCPNQLAAYVRPKWLAGGFALEDAQCLDRHVSSRHNRGVIVAGR